MPDLDRELDALRQGLLESVHPPEVETVVARSRQRASRRTRQLGAVAAVLVVGAAIPLLRNMIVPAPERVPPAAIPPSSGTPQIYDVDFADELHGFALRGICPADTENARCTTDLLYTEDAQHWYPAVMPPDPGTSDGLAWEMRALGPRRILVEQGPDRWYSDDAGRTWRGVVAEVAGTVAAIPDGALLRSGCGMPVQDCPRLDELVVVLPDSGRLSTLATPPPLKGMEPAPIPAGDGGWWVSGTDPATGRRSLAVSRDAGRTWTVSALPEYEGTASGDVSVTAAPDAVYATVTGEVAGLRNGLVAIFTSTDGGRTWTRTWQAGQGREPRSIGSVLVAMAEGNLLLTTENGAGYASGDAGRTFEALRYGVGAGDVRWTRIGYLTRQVDPPNVYVRLSPGNWTETTIG